MATQSEVAELLFQWAEWCVENLRYLDTLDLDVETAQRPIEGHELDPIDIAHARWATGTCITALDLCAASLGRSQCGHTGAKEFSVASFDPTAGRNKALGLKRRAQLSPGATQWLDGLLADVRFQRVKTARDYLTHSRGLRHFSLGASGRRRLELELGSTRLGVRQFVEEARDVAAEHVARFGVLTRIRPQGASANAGVP